MEDLQSMGVYSGPWLAMEDLQSMGVYSGLVSYGGPTEHGCVYSGPWLAMEDLQSMGVCIVDPGKLWRTYRAWVCIVDPG